MHRADTLSSDYWIYDYLEGTWTPTTAWFNAFGDSISVTLLYKELPFPFQRVVRSLPLPSYNRALYENKPDSVYQALTSRQSGGSVFDDTDLTQNGSLSRGIIVGSNQDFALESGLQFELSGQLTDDLTISASLTDASIPIQPDGTTQNIREFDQVYIRLQSSKTRVEMGDVDVNLNTTEFARLNRRLQGASARTQSDYGDFGGSISVARGLFRIQNFQGQDGFQGPYRLTGGQGEEFILVVAATERVYINGQRVTRGADNEYTIDYGLGEITFTSNVLILDETRIVVEYEYIDQNFNRTLITAQAGEQFADGAVTLGATFIRQADGDELLSQQTLTESDIEVLRNAGDNIESAIVSGARLATEDERNQLVLYARLDTVEQGQTIQIFRHLPGDPRAVFTVSFSNVGEGQGSYNRIGGAVNGLLYEWVGTGQGEYEPFRELPAPIEQQMIALNGNARLTQNVEVFGELAASQFDRNRFSSLDDGNNNDLAYIGGIRINQLKTRLGEVGFSARRRFSGSQFEFFERTRDIEFDRVWNINRPFTGEEAINESQLSLTTARGASITSSIGSVQRDGYEGFRQSVGVTTTSEEAVQITYNQDWVQTDDELLTQNGNWFRHLGTVKKSVTVQQSTWSPYLSFWQEDRRERNSDTDSLLGVSERFFELGPGIETQFRTLNVNASVVYRSEDRVLQGKLQDHATAIEQRYAVTFQPSSRLQNQSEVRIRTKEFTDAFVAAGQGVNQQGLFLKSITNYQTKTDAWSGQLFYEANTQRQALLQETFIEVSPEIGQYIWDDINEDGVQQLDEFFPELTPNEGTFIRQFLPSDELLPVINLNARFRNEIAPFELFSMLSSSPVLRGIRIRSNINIQENSTTTRLEEVYFLRLQSFRGSQTIQGRIFWEKELDVLNGWGQGDLILLFNQNRGLNQRSSETIRSFNQQLELTSRYNLTSRSDVSIRTASAISQSNSNQLQNRNFNIRSFSVEPAYSVTVNRSWRASTSLSITRNTDRVPIEDVTGTILKWATNHQAFLWKKFQTNARLEVRSTNLDGASSAFGAFELTDGQGEGTNGLWSVSSSYRLSNKIRLTFNYDGRTVQDRPALHTVKMVVSAIF
ncbi:MAG: hypothetical protein AAFW89_08755 [Bacteroidota bacterium]